MKAILTLVLLLTSTALLRGEDMPLTMQVLTETTLSNPELHCLAGQPAKLHLALEAPLGTQLGIKANLIQISHGIAAPLRKDIVVAEAVKFEDRTHKVIEARLPVPDVKRITTFVAEFHVQQAGNETWRKTCHVTLVVYPSDHLDSFKRYLTALETVQGLRLAVFGDSPALRSFLKQQRIPFADTGSEFPSAINPKVIYAGEASMEKLRILSTDEMRVIVFDRSSELLPGVYFRTRDAGFVIKVTLPLLDNLATNPQAQETFAQIFYQALPDEKRP